MQNLIYKQASGYYIKLRTKKKVWFKSNRKKKEKTFHGLQEPHNQRFLMFKKGRPYPHGEIYN